MCCRQQASPCKSPGNIAVVHGLLSLAMRPQVTSC
jgi:hypothetical protein